jgi:hypothetical protein
VRGSYRRADTVEHFTCGAGRYTSRTDDGDTLDLTTDHGRVRRLVADFDGWTVKGGSVGDELLWVRGEEEHRAVAAGFTGDSPAFDVAVARMLGLDVGATAQVLLVELMLPVGAARTVRQGWGRVESPDPEVERYEVADLATAERWTVNLAGPVVISREGSRPVVLDTLLST